MERRDETDNWYPCRYCRWAVPERLANVRFGHAKEHCGRPYGRVCMREQSRRPPKAAQSINYSFSTNLLTD